MNKLRLSILGLHPEPRFEEDKSHKDKKAGHQAALPNQERLWQWSPDGPTDGPLSVALRSRRMKRMTERLAGVPQTQDEACQDDPETLLLARFAAMDRGHSTAAFALQADLSVDAGLRVALAEHPDIVAVSQVTPVHLQAGTDNAVLMGPRYLHVEREEWAALQADLNQWLQADGISLFSAASGRHYLGYTATALERVGTVDLPPLGCALNRHVGQLLAGDELRPFRRWLTELQMWLYSHPVNAERAKKARPEINSLWVWGRSPWPKPQSTEASQSTWFSADDLMSSDNRPMIYTDSAVLAGALHSHDASDANNPVVILSASFQPHINELVARGVSPSCPVHVIWSEPLWCYLEGDLAGWYASLDAIDQFLKQRQPARTHAAAQARDLEIDNGVGLVWQRRHWLTTLYRRLFRSE
ncbi:hypothetical protein [Halothiobacillus sp.]|uniref:hypothetical protein n=1 Tax=Halothiobacillus sp. TaxID=1891311 RepID=UPI002608A16D|nr:hypothetical protein [Halothiobacillus sp.]